MTKINILTAFVVFCIGTSAGSPNPNAAAAVSSVASSQATSPQPSAASEAPKSVTKPVVAASTVKSNGTAEEGDGIADEGWEFENQTYVDTRRILYSKTVGIGKRPYMVYLQLTKESAKAHKYRGWLCGGVIVDKYYVLTSAACVEDADRFYIVAGTTKYVDSFDFKSNDCVCKHRRKVVWKCIPKNYKFDFQDSIKWSSNDIAIVKVDKAFKLGVCEKGCEFPVDIICYNNISRELEKPGTKGFIAGWGSGSNFREGVYRRQEEKVHIPENAKCLQEAKVCIMDNELCAKKWAQRFRSIITQYMICTKDVMKRLSELCNKKYANCSDVDTRRIIEDESEVNENDVSSVFNVDLGRHLRDPDDYTARRGFSLQGGFCENDHGGPLIVKYQEKERVIGVISACKIDPKTHNCHGPFLYTSVFRNRQFISCAIQKDVGENCRRVFRTGITHEEWQVNWDDYKEDDGDDDKASDKDEKAEKPEKEEGKEKDKEKETEKPLLRQLAKAEEPAKAAAKNESSSSSESVEASTAAAADKKGEKEEVKVTKEKKKKKSKKEKKSTVAAEVKKPKESGEPAVKTQDKADLFYESSREDNVNDPEDI